MLGHDLPDRLRKANPREFPNTAFELLAQAAAMIERLQNMAYKPATKHADGCDCIQCVPF